MDQRLTRILIILVTAGVTFGAGKIILGSQKDSGSPLKSVSAAVEGFGEEVLGEVVKRLPNAPNLDEVNNGAKETGKIEPIMEPTQNIEEQTKILIESIKSLPEDQIEAIRKQVYKEFCEGLLKGD